VLGKVMRLMAPSLGHLTPMLLTKVGRPFIRRERPSDSLRRVAVRAEVRDGVVRHQSCGGFALTRPYWLNNEQLCGVLSHLQSKF
jgi:hypothetical protein